jgi:hypothetical protein
MLLLQTPARTTKTKEKPNSVKQLLYSLATNNRGEQTSENEKEINEKKVLITW